MSTLHQVAGCDNPGRQVDVVFIHGLGGDAFGTWRCSGAEDAFWPAWLAEEVPEAGVWTLSYPAGPTRHLRWIRRIPWIGRWIAAPGAPDAGYAAALPDRAVQVLDQLRLKKAFGLGQRPLVSVCQSLGGLLAKHLLRASADATDPASQALAGQTRGVLFLATPHMDRRECHRSLLNRNFSVVSTLVRRNRQHAPSYSLHYHDALAPSSSNPWTSPPSGLSSVPLRRVSMPSSSCRCRILRCASCWVWGRGDWRG